MHRKPFLICASLLAVSGAMAIVAGSRGAPAMQAAAAEPTPQVSATPWTDQPSSVPAAPGTVIQVVGDVARPRLLDLKALQQMRRSSVTMSIDDPDGRRRVHIFTGVLLRDIIASARPTVEGGSDTALRAYAVVQSLSGARAIVSFPEFEPPFNGKQILVAYLLDGVPLAIRGIAELVVPEDASQGRFLKGLTSIEVGAPVP